MESARQTNLTTTDMLRQYNYAISKLSIGSGVKEGNTKFLKTQTSNETVLNESVAADSLLSHATSTDSFEQSTERQEASDLELERYLSPTPTPLSLSALAQKHQQAVMQEMPTLRYTSKNYFSNIPPPAGTSASDVKSPSIAASPRISSSIHRPLSSVAPSVPATQSPSRIGERVAGVIASAAEPESASGTMEMPLQESPQLHKPQDDFIVEYLSELSNGPEILLAKLKVNANTIRELISFLKKRSAMESEYGKQGIKLYEKAGNAERHESGPQRLGTFADEWKESLNVHVNLAQGHLQLAAELSTLAEELANELKLLEKNRKQTKETYARYLKRLQDARLRMERTKLKYDAASEDWEKAQQLLAGSAGANTAAQQSFEGYDRAPLKRGKSNAATWAKRASSRITSRINNFVRDAATPSRAGDYKAYAAAAAANGFSHDNASFLKLQKWEDESRKKLAATNEALRVQLALYNEAETLFQTEQTPKLVNDLYGAAQDSDNMLVEFLKKYGSAVERTAVQNAATVSPLETSPSFGLLQCFNLIRNKQDLLHFISTHALNSGNKNLDWTNFIANAESRGQAENSALPVFGVPLEEHMIQYQVPVPIVVTQCTKIIEEFGSTKVGIYRVGGDLGKAMEIKALFQKNALSVNLRSEEYIACIHNVAEALKLYFRELPDFLFPQSTYLDFIQAAKITDERLRIATIHDLVNKLPDANYATLKYLMTHLNGIQSNQQYNKMTVQALSVAWSPVLLGGGDQSDLDQDTNLQCKVLQVILGNFYTLFDSSEY